HPSGVYGWLGHVYVRWCRLSELAPARNELGERKGVAMGFFSGLKKAFDTGGIKITLDAPKTFSWEGDGIPVTVTVIGGDEPRTITALEFELEDDPNDGGPA